MSIVLCFYVYYTTGCQVLFVKKCHEDGGRGIAC